MNVRAAIAHRDDTALMPPISAATDRIHRPSPSGRDTITRGDGPAAFRRYLPAGTDALTGD
jgi:hypothetical protein